MASALLYSDSCDTLLTGDILAAKGESPRPRGQLQLLEAFSSTRVSTTVVTGKSGYHLEHRLHLLCALIIALRKLRCSIQIYIQRNWQSNQSSSNTNYYKYLCTVFDVAKN